MHLISFSSGMWCRFVGVLLTDFGRVFKRSEGNASSIALGYWLIIDATERMRWQERSISSMCDGCFFNNFVVLRNFIQISPVYITTFISLPFPFSTSLFCPFPYEIHGLFFILLHVHTHYVHMFV